MRLYRLTFLVCVCIVASLTRILGQARPMTPTFPSPNAASLGIFGEMPVSMFTGLPQTSIPLYEVKGNKISLPISLNYYAGGLRPENMPGWVGNGWALAAGGVITRQANGNIDELNWSDGFNAKKGFYFNSNVLSSSDWSTTNKLSSDNAYPNPHSGQAGVDFEADTQPDEFSFTFGNYSGKFFLDHNGQWQVQSNQALKIKFDSNDFVTPFAKNDPAIGQLLNPSFLSKPFGKFTIIDESGNQYIFGSTDAANSAIEFTDRMLAGSGQFGMQLTATSWFLTQIISADGIEKINLTYERGPLTCALSYSFNTGFISAPNGGTLNPGCLTPQGNGFVGVSGQVIFPVYLKSIEMPERYISVDFSAKTPHQGLVYTLDDYTRVYRDAGLITGGGVDIDFPAKYLNMVGPTIPYFTANTPEQQLYKRFKWFKLNRFDVKDPSGGVYRSFSFAYNDNATTPLKRLQLLSLSIADGSFSIAQKYTFSYNQTSLPAFLTTCTDHWGFNNMVPLTQTNFDFETLRNPDATGTYTQAEILSSIKYPTGGITTFTYELNRYSGIIDRRTGVGVSSESGVAGGLRVKKIVSSDGAGNTIAKEYYYVKNYTANADITTLASSGICDSKPVYNFETNGVDLQGVQYTYAFKSSGPIVPLTINSAGNFIGYTTVVEKTIGSGYTIYSYTNHDNGYGDEQGVNSYNRTGANFFACNSMAFKRGHILSKKDYSISGTLVAEEINTYTQTVKTYVDQPLPTVVRTVFSMPLHICPSGARVAVTRSAYYLNCSPFVLEKREMKKYASTGSGSTATTTIFLKYDQYKNVVERKTANSDGDTTIRSMIYAPEFTSTSDPINVYLSLFQKNMLNTLIEEVGFVEKAGYRYTVSGDIYLYRLYSATKIFLDKHYKLETIVPFQDKQVTTYDILNPKGQLRFDNHYQLKDTYNYDTSGNLSTASEKGVITGFIWDYNRMYPSAKIKNASNIYESGKLDNIPVERTANVFIPFQIGAYNTTELDIDAAPAYIKLKLSYNNNGLTGSNSSSFYYSVGRYMIPGSVSGNLCTWPTGSSSLCLSTPNNTTVNNLVKGHYQVVVSLTSCTGFQNYYGYFMELKFPQRPYIVVDSKKEVSHSSFEYSNEAELSGGAGNMSDIDLTKIVTGVSATGSKYLNLTTTGISTTAVNKDKSYVVSYWSKGGGYNVNETAASLESTAIGTAGWKYYEHILPAGAEKITIKGTGGIDEVRVYPKNALMETYTYKPRIGITSSCSENNTITYYQYDPFGRLSAVLDQNGNVLKTYEYSYQN